MQDTKPTRRPRISLLTLLLLITIAAMGITIWQLYSELVPLRVEVQQHRDTLGIFKIEEPDRIYAIRIANEDPEKQIYKYRVYLPHGKSYSLCYATSIFESESPLAFRPFEVTPGENIITLTIDSDRDLDSKFSKPFHKATLRLKPSQGPTNSSLTVHMNLGTQTKLRGWHSDKDTAGISQRKESVKNNVEVFAQNDPIVLLKIRLERVLHGSKDPNATSPKYIVEPIPDPADGFMLWIQPKTEEQNPL